MSDQKTDFSFMRSFTKEELIEKIEYLDLQVTHYRNLAVSLRQQLQETRALLEYERSNGGKLPPIVKRKVDE